MESIKKKYYRYITDKLRKENKELKQQITQLQLRLLDLQETNDELRHTNDNTAKEYEKIRNDVKVEIGNVKELQEEYVKLIADVKTSRNEYERQMKQLLNNIKAQ